LPEVLAEEVFQLVEVLQYVCGFEREEVNSDKSGNSGHYMELDTLTN